MLWMYQRFVKIRLGAGAGAISASFRLKAGTHNHRE